MKITVTETAIPGVQVIDTKRFTDSRGYFIETYAKPDFGAAGISCEFIQDNQSFSSSTGTVRGMHFQIPPFAQAKLIRVLRGRILDVALDIRRTSATYGRHVTVELGGDSSTQLFIPAGLAHGFCTLEPNTEVAYKVDNIYSVAHERGILWCDPSLGIAWPIAPDRATLSDKDRLLPPMSELKDVFT